MPVITTTPRKIYSFNPCPQGKKKFESYFGKDWIEANLDTPIDYKEFLKSNGLRDTIWAMRCEWFEQKETWMKFVRFCEKQAVTYATYAAYATATYVAAYAAYVAADAADADFADVAAYAAADSAYVADAADADFAATRKEQEQYLISLLS